MAVAAFWPTEKHLSEAREAIALATERYPRLTLYGFDVPQGEWDRGNAVEQVSTAIAYLRRCGATKRPNLGSYYLKHTAEHWGAKNRMSAYVANGSLIAAAVYIGLVVVPLYRSPNAAIGVTIRSVRALERRA